MEFIINAALRDSDTTPRLSDCKSRDSHSAFVCHSAEPTIQLQSRVVISDKRALTDWQNRRRATHEARTLKFI